jgi:hypothetical protein
VNVDQQTIGEISAPFAELPPNDNPTPEIDLSVDPQIAAADQPAVEAMETIVPTHTGPIEIVFSVENVAAPADVAEDVSEASPDLPPASENVLDQAFDSDAFVRSATLSQTPSSVLLPPYQASQESEPSGEPVSDQLLPSQIYVQDVIVGPEEDPGDLFEPMPMPSPVSAPAVSEEPALEPDSSPQRANMTPATHSVPYPAASDPLAAVRDLSEEELIALFS